MHFLYLLTLLVYANLEAKPGDVPFVCLPLVPVHHYLLYSSRFVLPNHLLPEYIMVNVQRSLGALKLSQTHIWPLHMPGLHDYIAILLRPIFLFSAITTRIHHGSSPYDTVHRK